MLLDIACSVDVPEELAKVVVALPNGTSREWRATRAVLADGTNDLSTVRFTRTGPSSSESDAGGYCCFTDSSRKTPMFGHDRFTTTDITEEEKAALVRHFLVMCEQLKVKVVVDVYKGQQPT